MKVKKAKPEARQKQIKGRMASVNWKLKFVILLLKTINMQKWEFYVLLLSRNFLSP